MGRQPRAKPDLSLLEGVKAYAPVETLSGGQSNRATLALLKRVEREIEEMERDYAKYVDDGQGSLISTDRLTPIYQFGKPEPTGYIDDATHRFWCVEQDEMRSPQYEDAVVCYEEC